MKKVLRKIISIILITIIICSVIPIIEITELFNMSEVQAADVLDLTDNSGAGGSLSLQCIWIKEYDGSYHWEKCVNHGGTGTFNGIAHTNGRRSQVGHSLITTGTADCRGSAAAQTRSCGAGCGYSTTLPKLAHTNSTGWYIWAGGKQHYKNCTTCGDWTVAVNCTDTTGARITCEYGGTCTVCNYTYPAGVHTRIEQGTCLVCGLQFYTGSYTVLSKADGQTRFQVVLDGGNKAITWNSANIGSMSNPAVYPTFVQESMNNTGNRLTAVYSYNTTKAGNNQNTGLSSYVGGTFTYEGVTHDYIYNMSYVTPDVTAPTITGATINPNNGNWTTQKVITVTANETWSDTVQIALCDASNNVLTPYGEASKSGNTFTRTFTPNIEAGTSGTTFIVKAKDLTGNESSRTITLYYVDNKSPVLTSTTNYADTWAKQKTAKFIVTDDGIGQVQISFNNQLNYTAGTVSGNSFSREYIFTGDVYQEQTRALFYKDRNE